MNSLDRADSEALVANLHSVDCVTLIENVLALARCIKSNHLSFDFYSKELQRIRYRSGTIRGYTSRLHYFTDWIRDNEQKGILKDMTKGAGGIPYPKRIDFMSTHRDAYPKLRNDSDYASICAIESQLAHDTLFYLPKSALGAHLSSIKSGDIIAITTKESGLDVSHTGIAIRLDDGSLHLLHAPNVGERVKISEESLVSYIQKHRQDTGILILRVREP